MSDRFTAKLRNYQVAPRKVRLVAGLVRGRLVTDALDALRFSDKKAAPVMFKLIRSAVSNIKESVTADESSLYVKEVRVDEGRSMSRFVPRARGRASVIKRRKSHITLTLQER